MNQILVDKESTNREEEVTTSYGKPVRNLKKKILTVPKPIGLQ